MEEQKKGSRAKKLLAFILIVIASVAILYAAGIIRKDCRDDKDCFDWALKRCISARLVLVKNNNVYTYASRYSFGSLCYLNIKLERVAVGADLELRRLLEGKGMSCKIPREKIKETRIEDMEDLMSYCHGELKEGLYELIIQRSYGLIISNMNEVVKNLERVLKR